MNPDEITTTDIAINKKGYTIEYLFKNTFALFDVSGLIESINLRCQNKYQTLEFEVEKEFSVPKSWGKCELEIIGDPGTSANLVQA